MPGRDRAGAINGPFCAMGRKGRRPLSGDAIRPAREDLGGNVRESSSDVNFLP